jgi:hypothetical protein
MNASYYLGHLNVESSRHDDNVGLRINFALSASKDHQVGFSDQIYGLFTFLEV